MGDQGLIRKELLFMNKIFTRVIGGALGLAMAIGVGVTVGNRQTLKNAEAAAGAGEALFASANFDGANSQNAEGTSPYNVSGYGTTWYNVTDTFKWEIANWNNNNNGWGGIIKSGNKKGSNDQTATISTYNAVSPKIVRVELNITAIAQNDNYSINLYVGNSTWTLIDSFTESVGLQSLSIPEAKQAENQKYKIVVEYTTKPTSNGVLGIDGISLYQKSSGKINSVTVKAGETTGTLNVTSGSLGWTNIQLTAVVDKTGTISDGVVWSSADSSKIRVTETGVARILAATSNDGVDITATSSADGTKSGKITIVATSLVSYSGTIETTEFTTESYGSSNITPLDTNGKSGIGLTNVRIQASTTGSGNPGYYSSTPTSLRMYKDAVLTISVPTGYTIDHVKIMSSTLDGTTPITSQNISTNKGELLFDGIDAFDDLSNLGSYTASVQFTTSAGPLHIGSISVAYRQQPEVEILNFCTSFVTTLSDNDVCGSTSETYNRDNEAALTEVQLSGKTLWEEQKEAFEALSPEAKGLFGTSEVEMVVRAKTLYLHIIDRYGLSTWTGAPSAATSNNIATINNNNVEAINVVTIVIIISSISLVALGGFLVIRRKKEQ